jgi:phage shock protein PspC (stress-responsive transcriptional regulator)
MSQQDPVTPPPDAATEADSPTESIAPTEATRTTAAGEATGTAAAGERPAGAGEPPGGFPPPGVPRRLTRSTQRKVVAGVAGGLGEYTGVDPVLFRVLFAVLTLFGGSGILLYAVCWLFLPADNQPVSPAESLIGRGTGGSNRSRDAAIAIGLIAAGLVLAGVLTLGDSRDLALVLVLVGGAFFLIRNLQERREGGPPQPVAPEPPPVAYQAFDAGTTATVTAPTTAPPAPPKVKQKREHSILGVLTISLLLLVLGVAAALDAGNAVHPAPDDYLALALGTLGLGLVVGGWFGRARWLTWLGLPVLAVLIVVGTSGVSLEGGTGDRTYAPLRAAEIQPEYRVGVGTLKLDLSGVNFAEQLVRTKVSAGIGSVEVVLPPDADVSIDGRAGIGAVDLLDRTQNGTSVSNTVVDYGPLGDGSIDLTLDLDVNIGEVVVTRA